MPHRDEGPNCALAAEQKRLSLEISPGIAAFGGVVGCQHPLQKVISRSATIAALGETG